MLTLYIPAVRVLVFNLATPLLSVLTVNTLDSLPEVNLILIFILLTTFLVFLFLTFTLKYLSVLNWLFIPGAFTVVGVLKSLSMFPNL